MTNFQIGDLVELAPSAPDKAMIFTYCVTRIADEESIVISRISAGAQGIILGHGGRPVFDDTVSMRVLIGDVEHFVGIKQLKKIN